MYLRRSWRSWRCQFWPRGSSDHQLPKNDFTMKKNGFRFYLLVTTSSGLGRAPPAPQGLSYPPRERTLPRTTIHDSLQQLFHRFLFFLPVLCIKEFSVEHWTCNGTHFEIPAHSYSVSFFDTAPATTFTLKKNRSCYSCNKQYPKTPNLTSGSNH